MQLKRKILNIFTALVMIFGSIPFTFTGASAATPPGEAPGSVKRITDNGDGSYDITLRIDGQSSEEHDDNRTSVVIVYDMSSSMTASSVYTLAENGTFGKVGENYVQLYKENGEALKKDDDYSGTLYYRAWNGRELYKGERYEEAKRYEHAEKALKKLESSLATYSNVDVFRIVFSANATEVSEFPYGPDNYKRGTNWEDAMEKASQVGNENSNKAVIFISDGNPSQQSYYNTALETARQMVQSGTSFYGIGVFGNVTNMQTLVTGSGSPSSHYYDVGDSDGLSEALDEILKEVIKNLTSTNIKITDIVTDAASTQVVGNVGAFRYNTENTSWGDDWERAKFENGTVTWNPGENKTLSTGEWASVTFTVWPSQEAMDCIAKIKNGGECEIENLEAYGLIRNGNNFQLKTNTSASFTYQTRTEVNGEVTDSLESSPQTIRLEGEYPTLPETLLSVTKVWADGMQVSQRTDEYGDGIMLTLSVDGEVKETYNFTGGEEGSEWTNGYTYAVAPGVMKPVGDDTSLRNVAKKIVTVEGAEYAVLEEGHDYTFAESPDSTHYELTKKSFHPMIATGGKIYDVTFNDDGTAAIGKTEMTKLFAENTLNGGILVSKSVVNNGKVDRTIEDKYTIHVQLTNDSGWYRILTTDADGNITRSDKIEYRGGEIVEEISQNQQIIVVDVPTGTTFDVNEDLPDGYKEYEVGYEVVTYDGTPNKPGVHEVFGNSSSTATITNYLESGNLVISKEVTTTNGDIDLARQKEFDFTVEIFKPGETAAVRTKTFKLRHGESTANKDLAELKNIPLGYTYKITEAAKAGFNDGKETIVTGAITQQGDNREKITNEYKITTPLTGKDAEVIAIKNFVPGREQFWLNDDKFTFIMTGNGEVLTNENVTLGNATAQFTVNISEVGTFEYVITEKEDGLRQGISRYVNENGIKDEDIRVIIKTKDNGDGTLGLESKTYSKVSKTIFNTYEANGDFGANGELEFTKVLEGRAWEDFDKYTFTLSSQNGKLPENNQPQVVRKGATTIDFGTIAFDTDDIGKTYNYVVTESIDENVKNVAPADEVANGVSFTITIEDGEDGTLEFVVSEYGKTFRNIYTPQSVSNDEGVFEITKTVVDQSESFAGENFTFSIVSGSFDTKTVNIETADEGTGRPDSAYIFAYPGTYTFIVKEVAGNNPKMTYDNAEHAVTIVVEDDASEGKLKITSTEIDGKRVSSDNKLSFKNIYKADPTTLGIGIAKIITGYPDGRTPDEKFEFTIAGKDDAPMPATEKISITGEGRKEFAKIDFEKAGTYTYEVKEVEGSAKGYVYDSNIKTVVVTVVDDNGVLKASIAGDDLTFTNQYKSVIIGDDDEDRYEDALTFEKLIEKHDIWDEGESYIFELHDENGEIVNDMNGNPQVATTGDDHKFRFGPMEFTKEDAGEHVYTIYETGLENSSATNTVTPGGIKYVITISIDDENNIVADFSGERIYRNEYDAKGSLGDEEDPSCQDEACQLALTFEKKLLGREWTEDDDFEFALSGNALENSISAHATKDNQGVIKFAPVEFTADDIGKTYEFTVNEQKYNKNESVNGITAETDSITFTVKVEDGGKGTLKFTVAYSDPSKTFINNYKPAPTTLGDKEIDEDGNEYPVGAQIRADVEVRGVDPETCEEPFAFELRDSDGNIVADLTINGQGGAYYNFYTPIIFEEAGTYLFTAYQIIGDSEGWTYDDSVFTVSVEVFDDGVGSLHAIVGNEPLFINAYMKTPNTGAFVAGSEKTIGAGHMSPMNAYLAIGFIVFMVRRKYAKDKNK